jgi:hypothetical protein
MLAHSCDLIAYDYQSDLRQRHFKFNVITYLSTRNNSDAFNEILPKKLLHEPSYSISNQGNQTLMFCANIFPEEGIVTRKCIDPKFLHVINHYYRCVIYCSTVKPRRIEFINFIINTSTTPYNYSTQWNSCPAPELYGFSWLDENMSHGANARFWLDDTAAYTFVGETTNLPRTVVVEEPNKYDWNKHQTQRLNFQT